MESDLDEVVRAHTVLDAMSAMLDILQDTCTRELDGVYQQPATRAAARLIWQRVFVRVESFCMKNLGCATSPMDDLSLIQDTFGLLDTVATTPKGGFDLVVAASTLGPIIPIRKHGWKQIDQIACSGNNRDGPGYEIISARETEKVILKWFLDSPSRIDRLRREHIGAFTRISKVIWK